MDQAGSGVPGGDAAYTSCGMANLQRPPSNDEAHDADDRMADLDLDLLDYLQSLTPAERVRRILDAAELVRRLREGMRALRGRPSDSETVA